MSPRHTSASNLQPQTAHDSCTSSASFMEHFAKTNLIPICKNHQAINYHNYQSLPRMTLMKWHVGSYCQPSVSPRMATNNHQDSYLMTVHFPTYSRIIVESVEHHSTHTLLLAQWHFLAALHRVARGQTAQLSLDHLASWRASKTPCCPGSGCGWDQRCWSCHAGSLHL